MDFKALLKKFLPQILTWLQGQTIKEMEKPVDQPAPVAEVPKVVDPWNDPDAKISQFFTVKECLWLPTWNRMANEGDGLNDEIKSRLKALCLIMDQVRTMVGKPINVHCAYRPGPYSKLVGGSETDVHTLGMAIDFDVTDMTCDQVKAQLLPVIEKLGLRMEDNGAGAGWVHLDTHPVGNARFFKA